MPRPRPRNWKRTLLMVVLMLTGGAIVNVAVAWLIGAMLIDPRMSDVYEETGAGPGGIFGIEGSSYWGWIVFKRTSSHAVRTISRWHDEGTSGGGSGGWPNRPAAPLIPRWGSWLSPENRTPCQSHHYAIGWEYGWPMKSLGGGVDVRSQRSNITVERHFAVPLDTSLLNDPNTHWNVRLLVFRPLWPGFAINTIFYAVILWVLWIAPGKIRRFIRVHRGLCPACAYPVGTSPVCTECGHALTPRRGDGV